MPNVDELKRKLAQRRVNELHRIEKASAPITIERMQSLINVVKTSGNKPLVTLLWNVFYFLVTAGIVLLVAHFLGG